MDTPEPSPRAQRVRGALGQAAAVTVVLALVAIAPADDLVDVDVVAARALPAGCWSPTSQALGEARTGIVESPSGRERVVTLAVAYETLTQQRPGHLRALCL